jgi:excisionase family DNA binding protein
MKIYETIAGIPIKYDPSPEVERFLAEVERLVSNPKLKERDVIAYAYGPENPLLVHDPAVGRNIVTQQVQDNPSYQVLGELLYRKRIEQSGKTPEEIAAHYTLTVAEAAEQLGVTPDAIRRQIRSHKIAAWKKGDEYFLSPRTLATLQIGSERGRASASAELHCVAGKGNKAYLFVKAPGHDEPIGTKGNEDVTIRKWRRIGVHTAGDGKSRFIEIENDPQARESPESFAFRDWRIEGPFKVVRKVNNAAEARKAWEAFRAV